MDEGVDVSVEDGIATITGKVDNRVEDHTAEGEALLAEFMHMCEQSLKRVLVSRSIEKSGCTCLRFVDCA